MTFNYYGGEGCCLTCPDAYLGCLCPECMCRQCTHYDAEIHRCDISAANDDKWVKVSVDIDDIIDETDKAWLILIDEKQYWFPKSLVKIKKEYYKVKNNSLDYWLGLLQEALVATGPKWLFYEKGLWELDEFDYWDGENDKH